MHHKETAIGFVIYNPSIDQLNRVYEASRLGFPVYVYDNSPEKINSREFAKNREGAVYLTCGKNAGLGLGMATVCAQAYYDGHSALVFFDQDTIFNSDTLNFIDAFYKNNLDLASQYSVITFNAKEFSAHSNANNKRVKAVMLAINSGSLFFLENLKKLNWHNHHYFVDCVDYEFCFNSLTHGFKIGEYSYTPGFDHSTEQGDEGYQLLGRTFLMRAYSLNRILDTVSASVKLLYQSLLSGKIKFFYVIFKLLVIYIATQLFVRVAGPIFKNRSHGG